MSEGLRKRRFLVLLLAGSVAEMGSAQEPAPRPTGPTPNCVTSECHADTMSGKVLHGPVAQKKCDACHLLTDPAGHLFRYIVPVDKLCTFCHVQNNRTVVHDPVAKGDCKDCHNPHGSDYQYMLVADPAGALCFKCHKLEKFKSKKYVHGPVAAGACVVCHEAHSSWAPNLLARPAQELCGFCHTETVDRVRQARHPHKPVLEGDCVRCHDPHASDFPDQLRGGAPDLCFSCHEHEPIKKLLETAAYKHGAVDQDGSCTACHNGHGGTLPKLLKATQLTLCLSCHDETMKATDGRTLTNMAELLKNNPDQHGPVRRADCAACHNPHASPNFDLLVKEYPRLFYAPYDTKDYALCFSCHIKELVTSKSGVGVTGFADGDRNLHYVHVHRPKKGRTCRACHEVHASKRPFHIRESVPFGTGGWELEINFVPTKTGGSCAPGCHEKKTYTRLPGGELLAPKSGLLEGADQ